jgi:glycosyltransferase involved in cell wall biosynthesis
MIVHAHYPVGESRGEQHARAAVDAGYAVHVICLRSSDEMASQIIDGVRVVRLPVEHVRETGTLRFFAEYLRFAFRATLPVLRIHRQAPIDVVYVHSPPDFLAVSALIPKLLGSGVVLDIHDLSPHMFEVRYGDGPLARLAQWGLRLIEGVACALADRVITVHEPYRDELVAHGVPAEKIAVVMNTPTTAALERARAAADGRRPGSFVVAYHGTVTHWYGVDLIVEAIGRLDERIPGVSGLIIGEGDALDAAEELARELGVETRIHFSHAYVARVEALRRVGAASCGVIPNRRSRLNRFALSSKLLDYVALGVPVVVARLETLAAHFGPDEVTFFEPDDVDSLAEAIAWVAEHPQEAGRKAVRARRRAEAYSWRISRERLLETLSDAAS